MKKTRPKAFTLVEVLVTLAVFTVILEAVYTALVVAQRSWDVNWKSIEPKQQLRRALVSMVTELREADGLFIVKDGHGTRLTFQRPDYGEVQYSWTDTGKDAGKIIRTNDSNRRALAGGITGLSFTEPINNEIIIKVSAGANKDYSLEEKVALRSRTGLFAQSADEKIK